MSHYPTTTKEINAAVEAGTHLRLSHSSMGVLSSCARKFEFRKLFPQQKREDNFAADVGSALHAAYQNYLIHYNEQSAIMELIMHFPHEAKYSMPNEWGKVPTSKYDPSRDFYAALATLYEMMKNDFIRSFKVAYIINDKGVEVPAIEVPFEIVFKGVYLGPKEKRMSVSYIGFIDAILQNRLSGMYRTTDIKTHRSTSSRRDAEFQFNGQQVPYGIVLQHILNQPVDEFEVHYFDCYVDLIKCRADNWVFKKSQVYMQEWLTTMILSLRQLDSYLKMDFFPRTSHGCLSFQKPCFYLNLCHSRDRKQLLNLWHILPKKDHREPHAPWITCELELPKDSL